jgi:[protein-PII] uridylyltransferase
LVSECCIRSAPKASSRLEEARRDVGDDILGGAGGAPTLERYTGHIDSDLRGLADAAPQPSTACALIALGGYGRRHLCPYSDLDILVLFGGEIGEAEEQCLRAILHPLWDAGLTVGQQVREIDELAQLEVDNPEFLLALTDARLVTGDQTLFDQCRAAFHVPETHAHVLGALTDLIDARHAGFNGTLYQLEPDVKEAPGGLRDISAIRTIAAITDPALLRRPEDAACLADAEDFLLRLRAMLHLAHRRNHNLLTHEMQERLADALGYPGKSARQRVEALMADYFRHARGVSRLLDRTRRAAPVPVAINAGRTRDGIRFIDDRKAAIQPATWLAVFQSALDSATSVSDEALALMRHHAERFQFEDFFPTAEHRAALLEFMTPRPGLYARLSEMHDCTVLGRMIPPFQSITCRVVRDFYHKYTVDEHTLLTVRNLERLADAAPERQRFASLLRDLASPELLVLALLLHDVGKWQEEDHASESVRIAERFLDQLRLHEHQREIVLFLIREHLRMSQVAFRRDAEDPEIVRDFATAVGVEERLKMLCLMTIADVQAVSPATLTRWKEELLWRLYVDTYNQLTHGYGDDLIERTQAAVTDCVRRRPPDLTAAEVTSFLEGLPRRYLQLVSRPAVYQHVRLARNIGPDDVHLRLDQAETAWELTVVTLDKPMLFANICGVLSSFGMDILRGHAMTNPNGLVLDVFQFADGERFLALNPDARDAILHAIEDVVAGRADVQDRLRRRQLGLRRRRANDVTPLVYCDDSSSKRYTIVEIVAADQLGLLHRIGTAISACGCEIDLVLIATEGAKAIDVFHITKGGAKLSDAEQDALASALQRTLEDTDEAAEGHHPAQ